MLPPSPDGYTPGYLVYLGALLIPGIGFGELFQAWRKEDGLGEKLGYVVGLGLAVDTIALMIKTSGLDVAGYRLSGIDISVPYLLMAIGVVALVASFAIRRHLTLVSRPTKAEAVLLLVVAFQAGLVYLFFQKFSVFPAYLSQDFRVHADTAQGLISGNVSMLPAGLLYYEAPGQIALSLLSVGGFAIGTAERTMAVLTVLSPLIVYLAAARIFSNRTVALLATVLYSFSGTVWFVSVFDAGLYANFLGIVASMFMVAAYADVSNSSPRVSKWIVFALAMVSFYMSHYSALAMLPAFVLIPLYQLAKDKTKVKQFLIPTLVLLIPAVLALAAYPNFYSIVLSLVENGRGSFLSESYLGGMLSGIPVLSYMASEINDDIEFVILLLLTAVYLVRFRQGSSLLAVPLVWLFAMLLVPTGSNTWRFAFEAVAPIMLMAGFAIQSLTIERKRTGMKKPRTDISKGWRTAIIIGVLLAPIIVGSWTTQSLVDSTTNTALISQSNYAVYNASLWMSQNTKQNASFLSLTDWRFSYINESIGRFTTYHFTVSQQEAVLFAKHIGASYIIVTEIVTIALPGSPDLFPWNTFKPTSNFTLAYSNSDVKIFAVT